MYVGEVKIGLPLEIRISLVPGTLFSNLIEIETKIVCLMVLSLLYYSACMSVQYFVVHLLYDILCV